MGRQYTMCIGDLFRNWLWGGSSEGDNILHMLLPPLLIIPFTLFPVAIYGTLTRRYYRDRPHVGETTCRKCGYILRGIREPICSECGEQI